jgi:Ca2+-binding RTX toxin-like protein
LIQKNNKGCMAQDFGNNLRTAKPTRVRSTPTVLKNLIGGADKLDLIRFNLTAPNGLNIRATGLIGRANLTLINRQGKVVGKFRRSGKNQVFNQLVEPGLYYIRIAATRGKGSARYTLRLAATPPPPQLLPPPPIREDVTWSIKPPGANQIPENIFVAGPDASVSGTSASQGGDTQVLYLSQLVNSETLAQILDSDGSENDDDNSNLPFIEFSLSGSRRLSRVEIEKIGTNLNGSFEIKDYKITLSISNDGRGSSSSGVVRLPDAELDGNGEDLSTTDVTRVLLDGVPFTGSAQSEWLYGSDANDVISGGDGNDYIHSGAGNDTLDGGNGDDYLNGGNGNDRLDGGLASEFGDNEMRGGTGDDYYIVRDTSDEIYEQASGGTDTVEAHVSFRLSSTNIAGSEQYVETLILAEAGGGINGEGSEERNTLIGNNFSNILDADEGDDWLEGRGGNDLLVGGDGRDTLIGGDGFDVFAFDFPSEGVDIIKDFQPGIDFIRLYQNFTSGSGFVGSTLTERVFYDETTGNLSFGRFFSGSTIFAQLETRPTFIQFAGSNNPLLFSSEQARFEF